MSRIFMLPSRLTKIKTKVTCTEILKELSEDNILTFKTAGTNQVTITPDKSTPNHYLFYYHNGTIEWHTPGFQMNEDDATKELYKQRKYFNLMWAD
jgi:hypothetical protein